MTKATSYANREITFRLSRTEAIEFVVRPTDKPQLGEISNNMDRVFEVARVTVKFTALADGAVPDPQPTVLDRLIKIGVIDISKNERIAAAQREDVKRASGLPLRQVTDSTFEWVPTEPVALWRGEALEFQVVPRESFEITVRNERRKIDSIRVEITVEGDSCILDRKLNNASIGVEAPVA